MASLAKGGNSTGETTELIFKVVIIGDAHVGKTSLTQRLSSQSTDPSSTNSSTPQPVLPTIGIDFTSILLRECRPSRDIRLQFWDCGGDPMYKPDLTHVLQHAALVVVVYDVSNPKSFEAVLREYLPLVFDALPTLPMERIVVVENKEDVKLLVESVKASSTAAMRKLRKAQQQQQQRTGDEASGAIDVDDIEIVPLHAVQGDLLAKYPDISFLEVSTTNAENIAFALSGMVDLLVDGLEEDSKKTPTARRSEREGSARPRPATASQTVQQPARPQGQQSTAAATESKPRTPGNDDDDDDGEHSEGDEESEKHNSDSDDSSNKDKKGNTPPVHPSRSGAGRGRPPAAKHSDDDDDDAAVRSPSSEDSADLESDSDDDKYEKLRKRRLRDAKKKRKRDKRLGAGKPSGGGCGCCALM